LIYTFVPKDVTILIGLRQMENLADGTFVEVSQANDTFKTKRVGSHVVRVMIPSDYYNLKLTLVQTSESNEWLAASLWADRRIGEALLPVFIRDNNSGTTIASAEAWVEKEPTRKMSTSIETLEWDICMGDATIFVEGQGTISALQTALTLGGAIAPEILRGIGF
jgi:hypothetical protein